MNLSERRNKKKNLCKISFRCEWRFLFRVFLKIFLYKLHFVHVVGRIWVQIEDNLFIVEKNSSEQTGSNKSMCNFYSLSKKFVLGDEFVMKKSSVKFKSRIRFFWSWFEIKVLRNSCLRETYWKLSFWGFCTFLNKLFLHFNFKLSNLNLSK